MLFGFGAMFCLGARGDEKAGQNSSASLCNGKIFCDGTTPDADRADRLPLELDRDASPERNDAIVVGMLDTEQLCSWLSQHAQRVSPVVEDLRGERCVDCRFNRPGDGPVLALEGKQMTVRPDDCD